jgi:hypothetical protein
MSSYPVYGPSSDRGGWEVKIGNPDIFVTVTATVYAICANAN